MTYPRACALIETIWSPKQAKSYKSFITRLRDHLERLDAGIKLAFFRPLRAVEFIQLLEAIQSRPPHLARATAREAKAKLFKSRASQNRGP